MYLQKGTQFHCGDVIGANEHTLYEGIMVFMITAFKNTVPMFIKACSEVTANGEWLSQESRKCIFQVINAGLFIRTIVADNHSANVNAFKIQLDKFEVYYITIPDLPHTKIFVFLTLYILLSSKGYLISFSLGYRF